MNAFFSGSAKVAPEGEGESPNISETPLEVFNIKGDQFSPKTSDSCVVNLTSTDMIALGLTTAIGGHYFAWNVGLSIGFGGFSIVLFLIATAFYCLILCVAELSSALPFAGGAYGIARVTLGIYPGFLVAVFDSLKSIIYASAAAYSVGQMISRANDGPVLKEENHVYEFVHWLGFYAFCLAIHLYGKCLVWKVNLALAAFSVVILFIYIFGAIRFVEFEKNAAYPGEEGLGKWFHGGMFEFMTVLPLGTRFFQGIQSINLACGQSNNPKTEVPKGYIWSMTFVMFTSFAVFFLATAVKPGLLVFIARLRPLSSGFKQIFGIPHYRAAIVSIPATVMSGFGFMYYYGQQLCAMGKSGLLHPVFGQELTGRNSPYVALLAGSAVGYGLCVVQYYYPDMQHQIYELSILGATTTFLSIFASFVVFRWRFPTIQREFVSPLGLVGAAYGCVVFALCFISVCGFQKGYMAINLYIAILAGASLYYYFVVQKRQVFSEEEKTVMFKAYVVKGNAARASRIRRGHDRRDKKYFPIQSHAEAPSLSTQPSSTPHRQPHTQSQILQEEEQQQRHHHQQHQQQHPEQQQEQIPEHRPVRWADGTSSRKKPTYQPQHNEKNKGEGENKTCNIASTGQISPQQQQENENFSLVSPINSVHSKDSGAVNSHLELTDCEARSTEAGTQFCDLV